MRRLVLISVAAGGVLAAAPFAAPRQAGPGAQRAPALLPPPAAFERRLEVPSERAAEREDAAERQALMQRKLEHAQQILEGVSLEDFELIANEADGLAACVDDRLWRSLQPPDYRLFRTEFEQIVANIRKAAKEKNADAAALAYVRLTINCVRCHQRVRGGAIRGADATR